MLTSVIKVIFILFLLVCFSLGAYLYSATDLKTLILNMGHVEAMREIEREEKELENMANMEGMENTPAPSTSVTTTQTSKCPNMLIKIGNEYYLYVSGEEEKEGVNPLVFQNLDEYKKHLDSEKEKGNFCPVLYVQVENDAQGQDVYRIRESPDVAEQQAGLPSQVTVSPLAPTPPPVTEQPITPPPPPVTEQPPTQAPASAAPQQTPATSPSPLTNMQFLQYEDATRDNPPYNEGNYNGFDPYGLYIGRLTEVDKIALQGEQEEVSDNPMDPNWGGILFTQQAVDSGKYAGNEITKPRLFTPKKEFIPILNSGMPKVPDPMDIF